MKVYINGTASYLPNAPVSNPDIEKILGSVSSKELGLGRFFAKVGTSMPRLGIADQNRIFCRFRVSHPLEALEATSWNRVRAAQHVGMPRRTFYRRLKEYDLL